MRRTVLWVVWTGGVLLLSACGGGNADPGGPVTGTSTTTTTTDTATAGWNDESEPASASGTTEGTTGDTAGASPVPKVFDETSMRESVRSVLVDSYEIEGVESVTCPPEQPVRAEATFDCTAVIDGETTRVPITVEDAQGRYQVGYPEDPISQP